MLCTRTESEAIPMSIPKLQDILLAQKRIRPYLARTPLYSYPAINELVGTTLFIKHENYQPTGAFKVRGGINLVSQMGPEERQRGIITASTGNHRPHWGRQRRGRDLPHRPRSQSSHSCHWRAVRGCPCRLRVMVPAPLDRSP